LSFDTGSLTLTTAQVAVLLRVNEHTVGRMAKRGEIPGAFRAGRLWRFPTSRVYRELLGTEPPTSFERSET
jgi:excisionase family DNA binding protein